MKSIRPAFDVEKRISKEAQEQSDMIGLRQENEELRIQLSQMMTACNMHRNDCIAYKNENAELKAQIAEAYRLGESVLEALAPVEKPRVEKEIDRSRNDPPGRHHIMSPMDVKDAVTMRADGATYETIADHFDVSTTTVRREISGSFHLK